MKIKNIEIRHGLFLAPMAGVTDYAYRTICKRFGAEYMVTEMVSAKAIHFHDQKTQTLARLTKEEQPCAVQIFGSEPEIMAEAARVLLEAEVPPASIDINMGCPMVKIAGNGDGSALMKNPQKAAEIVTAVKNAVSVPVTVKFRTGWNSGSKNAPEFAKYLEDAGADCLCIHGRTREQMYADPVDYQTIEAVKRAVSVPVIGNGGVNDVNSARRMLLTGVDGIALARGTMGNPWLFREIAAAIDGTKCEALSPMERLSVAEEHLRLLLLDKGSHTGVMESRRHTAYYIKGIPGAAAFRGRMNECQTPDEMFYALEALRKTL